MVLLAYLPQKHEFKVFIFLLDETKIAQNNSLFVWKTSNYNRGRSKLRNDMYQVTNMKSLGFTRERIANLLGAFPEVFLCDIDFRAFFDVAFDPHILSTVRFVVDRVAKLLLFASVAEADDSPAPTLRGSLLSPLLPPTHILENSFPNSCVTGGCWFTSISHFAMFTKSINNSTVSFGAFSLFIIVE